MVREENVSTVTRSPDLPVRGQRSKKVKISKYLNVKNTSVGMFNRDRQTKVSMVTSSCDLPFRGQRSKKVKTLIAGLNLNVIAGGLVRYALHD